VVIFPLIAWWIFPWQNVAVYQKVYSPFNKPTFNSSLVEDPTVSNLVQAAAAAQTAGGRRVRDVFVLFNGENDKKPWDEYGMNGSKI